MNDLAAHLVEQVFPKTPIRQWVCSMPWSLHYPMGYDQQLCAEILAAFTAELSRSYKYRAKHLLGLCSVNEIHTGSVSLVHRADSALRLNVHQHVMALDGVYVRDKSTSELIFHPLAEPTHEQVVDVASRTAKRVERILRKHGRVTDDDRLIDEPDTLEMQQPVLASCMKASASGIDMQAERAGQMSMRVIGDSPVLSAVAPTASDPAGPVASVRGFSVHANTAIDGHDRKRLERLCRYTARPPLAQHRVSVLDDGRVKYDLKSTFKDGTQAVVMHPMDFMARLCALVPPPYFHMTRYQGVLAPHSSLRRKVVPGVDGIDPKLLKPVQLEMFEPENILRCLNPELREEPFPPRTFSGRHPWAWLRRRVFGDELEVCPRCNGRVRIIEIANNPASIAREMAELGLGPMPPPHPLPEPPGQLQLKFV